MTKLKKDGNSYFINNKIPFSHTQIDKNYILSSLEFSLKMSFGEGFHRKRRSGGSIVRNQIEIFSNTFQGKLSEYCVIDYFNKNDIKIDSAPDTSIHGKGVWDQVDLIIKSKKINIKSCAFFSNLVLLETKDWNDRGEYIPNLKSQYCTYDYFLLVRIKDDVKSFFRNQNLSQQDKIINTIKQKIESSNFYYDIPGFFTTDTLKYIIEKEYILPKNSLLNGKIKMDADNYYIQSGSLKDVRFLINELK